MASNYMWEAIFSDNRTVGVRDLGLRTGERFEPDVIINPYYLEEEKDYLVEEECSIFVIFLFSLLYIIIRQNLQRCTTMS